MSKKQDLIDDLTKENDELRLALTKLQGKHNRLRVRVSFIWRWMINARPKEQYDTVRDHFLWANPALKASGWFHLNGEPKDE